MDMSVGLKARMQHNSSRAWSVAGVSTGFIGIKNCFTYAYPLYN